MALYEKHNDEAGIAYLWALMFRKIFLFDLPPVDEELEDMIRESNLRKAEQEGYYNWTIANEGKMIIPSNRNQRRVQSSHFQNVDSSYISKVWMRYYLNSVEPRLSNMWLKFHQMGLWTYTPRQHQDHKRKKKPRVNAKEDWVFIDHDFATYERTLLFLFYWPLYFLISMVNTPGDKNMVEGCYDAWHNQVNQWFVIEEVNLEGGDHNYGGRVLVDYIKRFTFAYVTILEFFYP